MNKYLTIYFIIFYFFSSEVNAQNLNLTIIGANDAETEVIKNYNYKKLHIDYNSILNEAKSLQNKITKDGYIENEYSETRKTNDSSFQIQFHLNKKYNTIKINYDNSNIDKNIIDFITKNSYKNYFVIPLYKVEEALNYINTQIASNGYPFTKIKLSSITTKDKNTLIANLEIIKDEKKRSLDKIVIKGYEKFPKSYLNRFLKIKPQKTFNLETIKSKMNTLNSLQFAEQIKNPEVLFTKDSTALYIYLKKSQSNTFDGFLGFSTNEKNNKINFNGYLNLNLNNNFNYGESFNLVYKSDESEQKNFEANLSLPYLFSTPIGTELSLKILKRDSSFTTVNQKTSLFYQLNSKNRIFLGVESETSNNLLDNEINAAILDYKSNIYNLKYSFKNRKQFSKMFQLKSKAVLELGIGKRKTKNENENQTKIKINAFHIFKLNSKNSFYTRFIGSFLSSNSYLNNELFRFGGINSIRGFKENSITANQYFVLNTEYRYQISNNIYTHSIIDFSNFENKIANTKENLYGFGLGFGIATKAGLLKFNFANGKTETQNFKFSDSKIHISLISVF